MRPFRSEEGRTAFLAAYDAVLMSWPVPFGQRVVTTRFGVTHVNVCGPEDAPPVVLLHGGGATSTVWFANVGALARNHRVYAVDKIGEPGRSVRTGDPLTSRGDLVEWLDEVRAGLELERFSLVGHSYGGWLALSYALFAPWRVARLVLLDPTRCFKGSRAAFNLRAVPLFLRPGAKRMRSFLSWETDGRPLDPGWLELACLGAQEFRGSKGVLPRPPAARDLRRLGVPTLVLAAAHSKQNDAEAMTRHARGLVPDVRVEVLPDQTHFTVPMLEPDDLNRRLCDFLG